MAYKKDSFKKPILELEPTPGGENNNGSIIIGLPAAAELYEKCPACQRFILKTELAANKSVCACGKHFRLSARQRIAMLADAFTEWDASLSASDPLYFPGYPEKLEKAKRDSGENESVLTGLAQLGKFQAVLCVMEPSFMMGSLGSAAGEKITRAFERATESKLPVLVFTVSGGARMQEGILSLMQMAKTSAAIQRHSAAGLLYITILTDPTTGGVTASFAMLGDIILAEPGALIGFAGPRVIEQTLRQTLPPGFQSAEFLLEKGFVDAVMPRPQQKERLLQLLSLHEVAV